ncbi:MAG: 3-keto-disaccharide hydrolase [Opitutales bacterium]
MAYIFTGCASTATGESAEDWEVLFERGDDLSKWKVAENPDSIRIEDGYMICNGKRAHAFYTGKDGDTPSWKNFEAEIQFMTRDKANGGLFFHSDWQEEGWPLALECQINATHKDHRKTGSIYALGDIESPGHKDGEWVTMRLKVVDTTVTVFVNGKQTNQWIQPEDHKLKLKRIREGTFALQAHDPLSVVKIRSLKVRRLP